MDVSVVAVARICFNKSFAQNLMKCCQPGLSLLACQHKQQEQEEQEQKQEKEQEYELGLRLGHVLHVSLFCSILFPVLCIFSHSSRQAKSYVGYVQRKLFYIYA